MTYEEIKEFIGKQVIVRDVGGKSFKGIIRRNRIRCRKSILWNSIR